MDSGLQEEPIGRDILLCEYQAAQDSAQHHDGLVWSITSILWASSLVLMGFVLSAIGQPELRAAITLVGFVAVLLIFVLWGFARQLRSVKVQKYRRCIALERQLGMEQHSHLEYSAGSQTAWYTVIMIAFVLIWLALMFFAWTV
jgi:hypothetical protein